MHPHPHQNQHIVQEHPAPTVNILSPSPDPSDTTHNSSVSPSTKVSPTSAFDNGEDSDTDSDDTDDIAALKLYLTSHEFEPNCSKNRRYILRRRARQFSLENGVLYYEHKSNVSGELIRRQVITSKSQRKRIIQQCHAINGVDGHFGEKKTLSAVQARFYWKGVVEDVHLYVKVCDSCQRENPKLTKVPATLHPIPVTAAFWHQVSNQKQKKYKKISYFFVFNITCF